MNIKFLIVLLIICEVLSFLLHDLILPLVVIHPIKSELYYITFNLVLLAGYKVIYQLAEYTSKYLKLI